MSARKQRSKKPSGANSRPPPDPFTLYLDQSLGNRIIAGRLRAVGARVEIHVAHLAPDAADDEWIALVGRNGWLALTKDTFVTGKQRLKRSSARRRESS